MADKHKHTRTISLMYTRLWHEWAYSFGACIVTVMLSYVFSLLVMPIITLLVAWSLNMLSESERTRHGSHCLLIIKQTTVSLTVSAILLALCLLLNHGAFASGIFNHGANTQLICLTTAIVFTTWVVKLVAFIVSHDFSRYCSNCKVRHGLSPHDAFVGNIIHNESKYLLKLAIIVSTVIAIVCWFDLIKHFSCLTFNGRDLRLIIGLPIVLFVISLIYLASIYSYTVHFMRTANIEVCSSNVTTLRYLVLRGDRLLVSSQSNKFAPQTKNIDTPASINIEYSDNVPEHIAKERFQAISGTSDFTIRPLYNNGSFVDSANVFHYAILIDDATPLPEQWALGNKWISLDQINSAWRFGELSPALAAEIHRIFTIVMTWKTYDRNGMRLYPIKNYYPTFRLRDFKSWTVDYSDMHWIYIANNNQDKPLYKVRKLIRKITTLHVKK